MPGPTVSITFLPQNKVVRARRGCSILEAAKANGIPIHYECDGNCTCGTCHVRVQKGADMLTPMTFPEREHMQRQDLPADRRLSCQARVLGSVEIDVAALK